MSKSPEAYKKLISERIEQTKETIDSLKEKIKPISPDNAIGRLSRLEAIGEKSVNESNLNQAQIRLKKLQVALQLIDTGEFGICTICEEEISEKRLEVMPESRICVDCLKERE